MILKLSSRHYAPRDRGLDDFSDDIITMRTRSGNAVLDTGFFDQVSDPDFVHCSMGPDFASRAASCAAAIRANARGESRRGPYSCLSSYDLRYRLMPHWERKEKLQALGVDPNGVILELHDRDNWSDWPVEAEWLTKVKAVRHAEFFYRLVVATQRDRISKGEVTPADAIGQAALEVEMELDGLSRVYSPPEVAQRLRERLYEALQPPGVRNRVTRMEKIGEHEYMGDVEKACLRVQSRGALKGSESQTMNVNPEDPDFDPWPHYTAAMRHLVPDMAEGAIVYEMDAGMPDDANTRMCAAVIRGGRIVGNSVERTVDKEWLRDFCENLEAEASPGP